MFKVFKRYTLEDLAERIAINSPGADEEAVALYLAMGAKALHMSTNIHATFSRKKALRLEEWLSVNAGKLD
jgi:hypothetical protein